MEPVASSLTREPLGALVLYVALPVIDKDVVAHYRCIPFRLATPGQFYVGLREKVDDAVDRFRQNKFFADLAKGPYVLFQVTFSVAGLAHYVSTTAGPDYHYAVMLAKHTYRNSTQDYGAWHFQGDLPLQVLDAQGAPLLSCEFLRVGGESDLQM